VEAQGRNSHPYTMYQLQLNVEDKHQWKILLFFHQTQYQYREAGIDDRHSPIVHHWPKIKNVRDL